MPILSTKRDAYAAIEAKYRCAHENRELRLRRIADGRQAFYRQCTLCGQAGQATSVSAATTELRGAPAPPFDNDLEHLWRARKAADYVATYHAIAPALEAEYKAYLTSSEWARRRTPIFERARFICECCAHFQATEVHHLTYERIGDELDADLLAVCNFCHSLFHNRNVL